MRAYLAALPDASPDERSPERVRACLASLQNPDVRYLVATLIGPRSAAVAEVAATVLRAAGARTAMLGRSLDESRLDGGAIDDALLAKAGTMAAASGYQLAATSPHLGELVRREGEVILALTAFAESSHRVALLLDPAGDPHAPVHAPRPDLVVVGPLDPALVDRALTLAAEGRPLVLAPLSGSARESAEARVAELGVPALVGGRDYSLRLDGGQAELVVRDEPYVRFDPPPGFEADDIATGIAAALALGALGIRMREEWILQGMAALSATPVAS